MSRLGQRSGELSGSDETSVPEKRRQKRSASEKKRIVEASFKPGASVRAVAEAHGLHPTQLYKGTRSVTIHLEFTMPVCASKVLTARRY